MSLWRRDEERTGTVFWSVEVLRDHLMDLRPGGDLLPPGLVIFDDAECLSDPEIGPIVEELLLRLPRDIPLLVLMAPAPNAREIQSWLEVARDRPCRLLEREGLTLPPVPTVLGSHGELLPLLDRKRVANKAKQLFKSSRPQRANSKSFVHKTLHLLRMQGFTPALVFLSCARDCDMAVQACPSAHRSRRTDVLNTPQVATVLKQYPFLHEHPQLSQVLANRVASFSTLQHSAWRTLIEALLAVGYLDCLFATPREAQEMVTRVRALVLTTSQTPEEEATRPFYKDDMDRIARLTVRRGAEPGCLIVAHTENVDIVHIKDLLVSPPEPITSQFQCNASAVLGLTACGPFEPLVALHKTLAAYQHHAPDGSRLEEVLDGLWAELPGAACPSPWAVMALKDLRLELELQITQATAARDHVRRSWSKHLAREHVRTLEWMLSRLPCERCSHQRRCHRRHQGLRKLWALMDEYHELHRQLEGSTAVLMQEFQYYRHCLQALGLISEDLELTRAGMIGLGVGITAPQLLALCVERGVVPLHDPYLAAPVVGGFVNCPEQDRPRRVEEFLSQDLVDTYQCINELVLSLKEQMLRWGIVSEGPVLTQAEAVMAWNLGGEADSIAAKAGISVDAMVRLIDGTSYLLERLRALDGA